jgi:hypothetical protein
LTASRQAGPVTLTATSGDLSEQAAFTQDVAPATAITSPAAGTPIIAGGGDEVTVTGTASSAVSAVDVGCRWSTGDGTELTILGDNASGVPVTGGTWTTTVDFSWAQTAFCQLVAVPAGSTPPQWNTFEPRVLRLLKISGNWVPFGPNEGKRVDYWATLARPQSSVELTAFGSCGAGNFLRYDDVLAEQQRGPVDCAASFPFYESGEGMPYPLIVDGKPAFTPGLVLDVFDFGGFFLDGLPEADVSASIDGAGDFVIEESLPLVACTGTLVGDADPVEECGALVSAGLRIEASTVLPASPGPVTQRVEIVSTDGASHDIGFSLVRDFGFTPGAWLLPGGSGFVEDPSGFTAFAAGASTIVAQPTEETSSRGYGLLTRAGAGLPVQFSGDEATEQFTATITTAAPARFGMVVAALADADAVAPATAAAEATLSPTVAIATAAQTVSAASIAVSGTATDAVGLTGVTVGGQAVEVAENGGWSRTVSLTEGANPVVVRATNVYGAVTERQVVITRTTPADNNGGGGGGDTNDPNSGNSGDTGQKQQEQQPPPAGPPPVTPPADEDEEPSGPIEPAGAPKAFSAGGTYVVAPGLTASCPEGGPACTAEVTATMVGGARIAAKKRKPKPAVAGKAKLVVRPGAAKPLSFKLSKKAARALRARGSIRLKVTVVLRSGGKVVDRTTRTIRVKAPRKKPKKG